MNNARRGGGATLGGARKKKRLIIKPYKDKPKVPANFFDDTWSVLSQAVGSVHRSQLQGLQQESLYKAVEDLCGHHLGAQLYQRLESVCDSHSERTIGCGYRKAAQRARMPH